MSVVSLTYDIFSGTWPQRYTSLPSRKRRSPGRANLVVDDGEPMETPQHLDNMTILIDSLKQAWAHRNDFYVGGNMFVYFSRDQVKTHDYRGPDFFVVLNTTTNFDRKAWVVWEEQDRTPEMVVELLSQSTKDFDLDQKKEIYRKTLKTPDYFVFDPHNPTYFRGWHLVHGRYRELKPNEKGWLWCESLGLWLGPWTGTLKRQTRTWLRFYDKNGQLLQMPEELERQQKEQAMLLAQEALQQASAAQKQADLERQQKEQALQQLEKLKELLRAHGIPEVKLDSAGEL